MRVKRLKQVRKAVRFFEGCYGFHPPYKILCDGNFVHLLLKNIVPTTPADTALVNTLGGNVKLFTTRCVIEELKRLAKDAKEDSKKFFDSLNAASNLMIARCDHDEKCKSAEACLTDVIGETNSEHFFVGTQDAVLRRKLQEVPGVPLIYVLNMSILFEKQSETQRKFVKVAEEKRLRMTDVEREILRLPKKRLASDRARDSADVNDSKTNVKSTDRAIKDKAQFKRKWAKGPNPLSCKKKKIKESTVSAPNKDGTNDTGNKSRKRKRSRKSKPTTEAIV